MENSKQEIGELVLPDISPMQNTNYQKFSTITHQQPLHGIGVGLGNKATLASTAGAGFSSGTPVNLPNRTMRTITD